MDIVQTRLRSPGDVLAAVPYLLGYKPDDSIVVLGLRRKKIVFQVRTDLPPVSAAGPLALQIADVVARQNVSGAVVVGYGPHDPVWPIVDPLCSELLRSGIAVLEALRADEGRYWSYVCGSEECCSPEGTAYDVTRTEVAAAATFAGMHPAESRDELVSRLGPPKLLALVAAQQAAARAEARLFDLIAPDTPAGRSRARRPVTGSPADDARTTDRQIGSHGDPTVVSLTDGVSEGGSRIEGIEDKGLPAGTEAILRAGRDAVDSALGGGPGAADDDLAWLALLLAHTPVRDHAWLRVSENIPAHLDLWTEVVRRVDPTLAAPPATLLAYAAWRQGEGTIASIALERALQTDPAYPMAHLLASAIAGGLAPGAWLDDELAGGPAAHRHRRVSGRTVARPTRRRVSVRRDPK